MVSLNDASQRTDDSVELIFVTDEIRLPIEGKEIICDLLALRNTDAGHIPVVIELKAKRAKAELIRQVNAYASLVDDHSGLFAELYSALLGYPINFVGRCEKWIVWPSGNDDEYEQKLAADGIRLVGLQRTR